MLKKIGLFILAGLVGSFVPFTPRHTVTLKVRYANYACQPCSLGFAYLVAQVYQPEDYCLLHQDLVLYYEQRYFAEYPGHQVEDSNKLTRVLCCVHERSLFDKLTSAPCVADVYKWNHR